jgi:signal transduction histidine kinase
LLGLDCVAALTYVILLLLLRHVPADNPPAVEPPGWVADGLAVAIGLPLSVRRRWPLAVLTAVLAASVVALPLGVLRDPFLATAFALYPVSLAHSGRNWIPVAAAVALVSAGAVGTSPTGSYPSWWLAGPGLILIGWLLIGGTWMLGRAVREQRASAAREAERLAQDAVMTERLHIARELHDVVAHSVGIIAVKAAVANHVARNRPGEAAEALQLIETTSRAALAEMRQLLGVLRWQTPGDQPADLAPLPGPAGLTALADRAATAGLRVELDLRGTETVSGTLGLTIYRIVQESLTNAAKYAAPTRCRVLVDATGDDVFIEVSNDGPHLSPARTEDSGGHGLIGMRERVGLYGGTFAAGPRPDGGYRVTARIPPHPYRPTDGGVS